MTFLRSILRLCLLLALVASGTAAAGAAVDGKESPVDPEHLVRLSELKEDTEALRSAERYVDPTAGLSFQDLRVMKPEWAHIDRHVISPGFTKAAWWMRLHLKNDFARQIDAVVDLGATTTDNVQWYVLRPKGNGTAEFFEGGDTVARQQGPQVNRSISLSIPMEPDETVQLYVRLHSDEGYVGGVRLRVAEGVVFREGVSAENILFGVFCGGILALSLYNLMLFVSSRNPVYGWYILYTVSFASWSMVVRGYAAKYIWPDHPALNNYAILSFAAVAVAAATMFHAEFLAIGRHESGGDAPRRSLWAARITALACAAVVFMSAGSYSVALVYLLLIAPASTLVQTWMAIGMLRRNSREARYSLAAIASMALPVFVYVIQEARQAQLGNFGLLAMAVGGFLNLLCLALGVADWTQRQRAQVLFLERNERENQEHITAQLGQLVQARTAELMDANHRLEMLSRTDELTGAYNRRHFNAIAQSALLIPPRIDAWSFCMFDIDHFKGYNDHYGHQAGDTALKAVAHAVKELLKRSNDSLFRLGGEEFGVLFTARSKENALAFVERMRVAIEELQIPHAAAPRGYMTASFGVAWWDSKLIGAVTPENMYARADAALYEAKAGGRNRVCAAAEFQESSEVLF